LSPAAISELKIRKIALAAAAPPSSTQLRPGSPWNNTTISIPFSYILREERRKGTGGKRKGGEGKKERNGSRPSVLKLYTP